MIHEHKIDVQGWMVVHESGNRRLINRGDLLRIPARRTAAFCSRKLTVPALAPFGDQGYPFPLIVVSANRMKVDSGGGSRVQEMSRTVSLVIK
jgi:hypothetical protein